MYFLTLNVFLFVQIWCFCPPVNSITVSKCSPLNIKNGNASCSNTTCRVACHSGYFLIGPEVRPCSGGAVPSSKCVGFRIESEVKGQTFGRLDIDVDGRRGYLINYRFTIKEANVVCRMLGFDKAYAVLDFRRNEVPRGRYCFLLHARCTGNESSLNECRHSGLRWSSRYYCWSSSVAVICGSPQMSARIKGSNSTSMGRVEVSVNGTWGKVAYSKGWTIQTANVVCRMFGLSNATSAPDMSLLPNTRPISGYTWMKIEKCTGHETSIFDCNWSILGRSAPYEENGDAGVICGPPKVDIFLQFPESRIGQVTLSINGIKANLGTNNWDGNALAVVCRMLGMHGPHDLPVPVSNNVGIISNENKELWLDQVKCFGNESSVLKCRNPGLRNRNRFAVTSSRSSTAVAVCGRLNITVRLTGSQNKRHGIVNLFFNGLAGVFFNLKNDLNIAKVICRTLGLPAPYLFVTDAKEIADSKKPYETLEMFNPRCQGNEQTLSDCNKSIRKFVDYGTLPGVICGKDFYCPAGCRFSYLQDDVDCINANLTEAFNNTHIFTSNLSLTNTGEDMIDFGEDFLLRLPLALANLVFHNNDLKVLDPWFISRYIFKHIEIHDNNITTIKKYAFSGLPKCHVISLIRNNIRFLEAEEFGAPLSLIIEGNNITTIKQEQFFSRYKTEAFRKEVGNRLSRTDRDLADRISASQYHIRFLALPNNRIMEIENAAFFYRGRHLRVLLLQNNLIKRIKKLTFRGLSYFMHTLWLSSNPLEVIEDGAFGETKQLRYLNLVNTNLHNIVPGLLIDLIKYQTPLRKKRSSLEPVPTYPWVKHIEIEVFRGLSTQTAGFRCNAIVLDFFAKRGYIHIKVGSSTKCFPCPYGTFKHEDICLPCPAGGFYQDEQAQYNILSHGLGCKQCPVGSFVSPQTSPGVQTSDCQACPDGTRHDLPALFRACFCLEGHYRLHRFQKCQSCQRGYKCMNETINLLSGFFWKWNSTKVKYIYTNFSSELQVTQKTYNKNLTAFTLSIPKAYACPVVEACKGGMDSECSIGYEGPLCAVCSRQFYRLASMCRKCPTLPWIVTQIALAVLIVVGLFFLFMKDKQTKSNGRSVSDIMTSRLKILIGFYQVTSGTISSFSYVQWPDAMIKLVRYAEVFQMNLLQVAPLRCISHSLKSDVHVKLLLIVLFNAVAVFAGILYYLLKTKRKTANRNNRCTKMDKSLLQQQCYRIVFLVLFILYPVTCSYIFQVLPEACHKICTSADEKFCKSYLKSDYSVECGNKRFNVISFFSYVLIIYPIGFPSLIFYLLWKYYYNKGKYTSQRKEGKHDGIIQGLKFVYENYARNVWFWEIIELVRKVVITSVILLAHAESRTYLGVTAIISGLYAVLFAYYKPITDTFEHWLQLTSLLATMVNMIVGMLLKIPSDSLSSSVNSDADEVVVTAILMLANVAVIAIMAIRYITTFIQAVQTIRKNPQCSLSCCLYLFLTINEAGNDISGGNSDLKNYQDMNTGAEKPDLEISPVGFSIDLKEDDEKSK